MGRQSRTLRQFTNLHEHLFSSRRMNRYELERTLSQGDFSIRREGLGVALRAALSAAPEPRQERASAIRLQSLTRRAAVAGLSAGEAPRSGEQGHEMSAHSDGGKANTAVSPFSASIPSARLPRGILDRPLARTVTLLRRVSSPACQHWRCEEGEDREASTSARGRWTGLAVEGQGRLTRPAGSPPFSRLARGPAVTSAVFLGFPCQPHPRRPRMDWV